MRRSESAPRACGSRRCAERAGVPLVRNPLLLLASPRQLTESRHDDRASAAEPRASRSFLIAPPASPGVRRSQFAPRARGRRRRVERADAPLVLSPLLLLALPRQLTESRHDDRASAAEPRASRRSRSLRQLHRACVDRNPRLVRAAVAAAPSAPVSLSCSARCCSLRHRAGSPRADTTTERAPPSRERVVVPDRAAGFAERASISIRASRVRPPPPRRARRCSSRAQLAAAPCVTAPAHREPTRRPRERRRAASESSFLVGPPLLRPSAADSAVGERVALHTTANFVDVTASYAAAAPPIAAPSLLSRHDDGERAPSREHFVVATERRWLLPACAGLVVGKRHQAPRSTSMSTARLCPRQASERFDESSGRARRSHRGRTRS